MKLKRLKVPQNAPMVMVSMRMPAEMVAALKKAAAKRKTPYQTLVKEAMGAELMLEMERMMMERRRPAQRAALPFQNWTAGRQAKTTRPGDFARLFLFLG